MLPATNVIRPLRRATPWPWNDDQLAAVPG
jgi:hypothetical protein